MECIFYPELSREYQQIEIRDDEFRHVKALRLNSGDKVMISSGKGLIAEAIIEKIERRCCNLILRDILKEDYPEIEIAMALGILDNRERFEFAVEKSVELGVNRIIPLICDFSQRRKINTERLRKKTIAAMKQCKRAYLPVVDEPMALPELIKVYSDNRDWVLTDINGSTEHIYDKNLLVLTGPEGGFSPKEIQLLNEINDLKKLWLANKRLRAETAAIAAMSLISVKLHT